MSRAVEPRLEFVRPPDAGNRIGQALVVDDDEAVRARIAALLRDQGHQVSEAADGAAALRAISDRLPDVVLLDVLMAGMDGIEVCRRLRARHSHVDCPVIFLTGLADNASRIRCLRAGGNDFLSRPVSAPELLLRVGNLVQLKRQHQLLAGRALQLEATVAARTAQLRSSQEEAISRLATAVELRDGITAQHGMRVGSIAALIGEGLGFNVARCDELRVATTMHDVGKVAIPDRILMKPGRLTGPEFELMKRHSILGERLIGGGTNPLLRMAALVAGSHHERMDGSGYPRGLRGADIPIEGRIAAVADVFDATSTPRRYRAELSVDQSVEILRAGRGQLFDPEVLDAFLAQLPQILELAERSGLARLRELADGRRLPAEFDPDVLIGLLDELLPEPQGPPNNRLRGRLALEQEPRPLAAPVNSSGAAMMSLTLDGTIDTWNTAAERLFGYRASEIIGLPLWTLVPAAHLDAAGAVYSRMLQTDVEQTVEMPHLTKDGSSVDARLTLSMQREGDQVVGFLGVISDISEERQERARLAQTTQLAGVGMLAAGVAHEISNPLTWVLRSLRTLNAALPDILRDPTSAPTKRLTSEVADALDGARRMEEVVWALQSLARSEDDRTAPVQMDQVMATALNLTSARLHARARVVEELASVPLVEANAAQLCHVFVSLLVNAFEAIEEGAAESNRIIVRTREEGGAVIGEITDSGSGIAPDTQERIFDPYFSTRERSVGTGLGLSVCQGLLSAMGGLLEFESQMGQGTTFRVRLPAQPHTEPAPVETTPDPASSPGRARVLVVDDEPMLRTMLVEMLSEHHDVVAAASADEAEALLDRPFDVILCDLIMPHRTGIELHQWIAEHRPALQDRVLFMSGGCFRTEDRDYLDAMPTDSLAKPFSEDEVLAALGAVVEARGRR
jgi:PAS domain S-box-containing protein